MSAADAAVEPSEDGLAVSQSLAATAEGSRPSSPCSRRLSPAGLRSLESLEQPVWIGQIILSKQVLFYRQRRCFFPLLTGPHT